MVETGQILEMRNVLSCRRKASQMELQAMGQAMGQAMERLMQDAGATPTGPTVTATFAVDQSGPVPAFDMELLIPVDKMPCMPEGFQCKEHFLLTNALKIRHIGNPSLLQASINELNQYIVDHGLTPISVGYNVTVKAPHPQLI